MLGSRREIGGERSCRASFEGERSLGYLCWARVSEGLCLLEEWVQAAGIIG